MEPSDNLVVMMTLKKVDFAFVVSDNKTKKYSNSFYEIII